MIWTAGIVAVAYQFLVILPAIFLHLLMPGISLILLAGLSNILTMLAIYGYLNMRGVAWEVAEPGDVNLVVVGFAAVVAVVAVTVTTFLSGLLAAIFGPGGLSVSDNFLDQINAGSQLEILFTIVLVAPLAEEFIYRGLFMGVLLARGWTPVSAAGLSALIFAVQHIQYGWIGIAMVLVYGFVLGMLRVASGGLFAPIMAHLFINLISISV
jgi:membrane protease YdiL (CAAX protease family)